RAAPGWRHRRGPGRRPGRHTAIRNRSWLLLSLGGLIPGAVVPMDAPVALGKTGLHLAAEALLGDVRQGFGFAHGQPFSFPGQRPTSKASFSWSRSASKGSTAASNVS